MKNSAGIYALPSIYAAFNKKLADPKTTNIQLADVIQLDAGLTSYLLKIVNSPLYGFSSSISNISHAISIVGRQELATLVIGKCVVDVFSNIDVKPEALEAHWKTSLTCAILAKNIAAQSQRSESPETFFVAGLIHGIGKLVIWREYPKAEEKYRELGSINDYLQYEHVLLGTDYPSIGAHMASDWGLPLFLVNTTQFHLNFAKAIQDLNVAVVFLALQLVKLTESLTVDTWEDNDDLNCLMKQLELSNESLQQVVNLSKAQFTDMRSIVSGH
ncbi:HDOD domain-containing protein [Alteromonas sp. ASW11-36]|uniref:HDOD domain-containing protein n=1 Tax=Alteromonas arenosi TaxID=3055817 RepID=A0ABT7T0N4_9ALTE|nr:HDOD domain-containing protein [Alteromonas sp. ASW11-36]